MKVNLVAIRPDVLESWEELSQYEEEDIHADGSGRRATVAGLEVEIVVSEQYGDEYEISGHVTDELAHWRRPGLGQLGTRGTDMDHYQQW